MKIRKYDLKDYNLHIFQVWIYFLNFNHVIAIYMNKVLKPQLIIYRTILFGNLAKELVITNKELQGKNFPAGL